MTLDKSDIVSRLKYAPIAELWRLELWLRYRMRNGDNSAKTEWFKVKEILAERELKSLSI